MTWPTSEKDYQKLYSLIVANLPVAIFTTNKQFEIISFNPQAEKITGYSSAEAIGQRCADILCSDLCENDCPLQELLDTEINTIKRETYLTTRDSERVAVIFHSTAMFTGDGKIFGYLAVIEDISREKEQEREKTNFQSMIAHDLKSRLVTIEGLTSRLLAKKDTLNASKQQQYLESVKDSCVQLNSLVEEFLEFSRLQTGHLKFELSNIDIRHELEKLVKAQQAKAAEKKIKLKLNILEELPEIRADKVKLCRVFDNLIDNAIKFSKADGIVSITAGNTEQNIIIRFKDNGIGIDPEQLPYIFDAFHRGRMKEQTKGYGLGLATVKIIIKQHGGKVHAASERDKGTTFTIRLPKQQTDTSD